jgi:hypothetical protein
MDIALLVYSHSEYYDILEIFCDRLKKYLNVDFAASYLCIDESAQSLNLNSLYNFNDIFYYKPDMSYGNRMKETLSAIKQNYVLIFHENNILIDTTDSEEFHKIEEILYRDAPDQLRLHAGPANVPGIHIEGDVYKMVQNDPYKFSVYPTIWKKTSIIKLFETFHDKSYRDIEGATHYYTMQLTNYYIWNYDKCPPVGHCASEITPHVIKFAHCIVRGEWTTGWHFDALLQLKKDYNINFKLRGFHNMPCFINNLPSRYNAFKINHVCKNKDDFINALTE